ncbi:unnamed protein product, partial [Meganyctiphanes norvegica]
GGSHGPGGIASSGLRDRRVSGSCSNGAAAPSYRAKRSHLIGMSKNVLVVIALGRGGLLDPLSRILYVLEFTALNPAVIPVNFTDIGGVRVTPVMFAASRTARV